MTRFKQKAGDDSIGVFDDDADILLAVLKRETKWGCVFLNERFPVYLDTLESIATKLRELNTTTKEAGHADGT